MSVNQVKLLNYNATKTVLDKCELREKLREGMSKKKKMRKQLKQFNQKVIKKVTIAANTFL